jgi:ferrochelatase
MAGGSDKMSNRNLNRWAVLLLAHGAPDRLEDIPEFLLNVRGGRPLPDPVVQEIIRRYSLIGGGSPLICVTTLQAQALAERLGHPVYFGMRNWKPFIADTVRKMVDDGVERMVALCLAPQNSRTSIGLYKKHLHEALEKHAPHMVVDFMDSWHDHPLLIQAFLEKVVVARAQAEAEARAVVPIVFTAHSVPEKTIQEGDPYADQVRETARLVAEAMGLTDYRLAFQSQGMTAESWIGPTVESQIDELAAQGHRHVLLAPVGFVSDHVEILYDIDILFREYGRSKGVTVHRSESLNDSMLFIKALTEVISWRVLESATRDE